MDENVIQQNEMLEIGVVKYYHYDSSNGKYPKDCLLFVKFIHNKPILLAEINDKMLIIDIGDFKHLGDKFNGKIGLSYFLNIPSTVMSVLGSSIDK